MQYDIKLFLTMGCSEDLKVTGLILFKKKKALELRRFLLYFGFESARHVSLSPTGIWFQSAGGSILL